MSGPPATAPLLRTPLYDLHVSLGAKMVPFAGYEMPVQYPLGVLKEHLWTREKAGLFDVSHMGQAILIDDDNTPSHETVSRALEALVPADIANMHVGQQRYTQLLAADGGIIDDLMVSRSIDPLDNGKLFLVVNAGCKEADFVHISSHLPASVRLEIKPELALLALQGPAAASVLANLSDSLAQFIDKFSFMTAEWLTLGGIDCLVSRSGYTGEDGFEISIASKDAADLWKKLSADDRVQPIGLGARDSLRLEAGLCLYGHDIDTTNSPIEAGLNWSIQKRRRTEGGFPGASRIQQELKDGPSRLRVGIKPDGRAPAREGTEIVDGSGAKIGVITSGGFGPSVNGPVAMGYVAAAHAKPGTAVQLMVRGKPMRATIVAMPFAPHRYKR